MDPMRNDIAALQHGVRVAWFIRWAPVDFVSVKPNRDSAGIFGKGPVFSGWNLMQMLVIWRHFPPKTSVHGYLGGGLKYFLFSPLLGEDLQFD